MIKLTSREQAFLENENVADDYAVRVAGGMQATRLEFATVMTESDDNTKQALAMGFASAAGFTASSAAGYWGITLWNSIF